MALSIARREMVWMRRLLLSCALIAGSGVGVGANALAAVSSEATVEAPVYFGSGQEFVAAHGERALVMGYPDALEIWAYPLQLLSGYKIRFRVAGQVASLDGARLLRRVEHHPSEIVRVYVGPDFVVREHLFVPRREAAAIIRYEVEGRPQVKIEIGFQPSLDLMWPGALGGQSIGWDNALAAYIEREPLHRFSATIASPEAIEHDATINRTRPLADGVSLLLDPRAVAGGRRMATLYVIANPPDRPAASGLASLKARSEALRGEALADAAAVQANALQIVTPDPNVNRALASALLALDQAWVCNDAIGCGAVAGYGPSRPGRRPQYAWFFAGDGLVAMQGMLAAGQYSRARAELEFVTRYQNNRTGMIWHEISQSAALIDWQNKYHYMFVHVDITFQYLASVADYVATTGDTKFVGDHWRNIQATYTYCTSLIDAATGLPHIPAGKQGQNEQDQMRDDIRLSTVWIDAAKAFAELARIGGHAAQARDAAAMADRARTVLGQHGWDDARGFWLSGHTLAGEPVHGERPDASGVLLQDVFSQDRVDTVLDRIASPEFQTDWGIRSLSANAPDYDPNLYGSGSVWALGTASVATTFWKQHRPLTAWSMWNALVPWNTLDSPGHLHEVLAGDIFHPEVESVPEQTWSSASLLTSAVRGLLGIEVRSAEHRVEFAPYLPEDWRELTVRNVAIGTARLGLRMIRDDRGWRLRVENTGDDVVVDFAPAIPLGATLGGASIDGTSADVRLERHPQDNHARLRFTTKRGVTQARIDFAGGVEIRVPTQPPVIGDGSANLKIVGATYKDATLSVDGWVTSPERASFILSTKWRPGSAEGAQIKSLGGDRYEIRFDMPDGSLRSSQESARAHAVIHLEQ